ncbi:MAG: hypothetical protein M3R18_08885 [Pseudomonadota bacterium]|nr:hypothetical protein [Pseudomonadota bacterium]
MTGKRRSRPRPLPAALIVAVLGLLPACSSLGESIPASIGGLPIDAPARAADPPVYPAVHDMPPTRPTPVLDEYSKKKLEDDLVSARDRQEGRKQEGGKQAGRKPAAKKPLTPPAPPAPPDAGAARNP